MIKFSVNYQFILIIILFVFIISYFPARFGFDYIPNSWIFSIIFNILFSIPLILVFYKKLGGKNFLKVFAALSLLGYFIESIGVYTGFPYSKFEYTNQMGPLIFNLVPYTLPFGWVPMVLSSYFIFLNLLYRPHDQNMLKSSLLSSQKQKLISILHNLTIRLSNKPYKKVIFKLQGLLNLIFDIKMSKLNKYGNFSIFLLTFVLFLILFDLVLDPAAIIAGLWIWEINGLYYGIPLMNYFGWGVSSLLAFLLLQYFNIKNNSNFNKSLCTVNIRDYKTFSLTPILYIAFWTSSSFWFSLLTPTIIGIFLIIFLLFTWKFYFNK